MCYILHSGRLQKIFVKFEFKYVDDFGRICIYYVAIFIPDSTLRINKHYNNPILLTTI